MDRFFVWISRINSILFLLVLVGVAIGTTLVVSEYRAAFARYHEANLEIETEPEPGEEPLRLSLGEVDRIHGTDVLMIQLFSEDSWSGASYKPQEEARNALFLSDDGRQSMWLFKRHTNLVLEIDQLRLRDEPTMALYYEFIQADTDDDGELTRSDTVTIALSKPDGSGLTEILSGVTRVLSHDELENHQVALVYQIGDAVWHARFDLDTFAKLSEQSVVEVPQQM